MLAKSEKARRLRTPRPSQRSFHMTRHNMNVYLGHRAPSEAYCPSPTEKPLQRAKASTRGPGRWARGPGERRWTSPGRRKVRECLRSVRKGDAFQKRQGSPRVTPLQAVSRSRSRAARSRRARPSHPTPTSRRQRPSRRSSMSKLRDFVPFAAPIPPPPALGSPRRFSRSSETPRPALPESSPRACPAPP